MTETVFVIWAPAPQPPLHENEVIDPKPERFTPVTPSDFDVCWLNSVWSLDQHCESGTEIQPELLKPGCKAIFDRRVSGFSQ
jgi:hypothetical protein